MSKEELIEFLKENMRMYIDHRREYNHEHAKIQIEVYVGDELICECSEYM